jgi:hypothetical protein
MNWFYEREDNFYGKLDALTFKGKIFLAVNPSVLLLIH